MYDHGFMLWDREAEGGPAQVYVANAAEALQRDPKRYSRNKPEAAASEPAAPVEVKPAHRQHVQHRDR